MKNNKDSGEIRVQNLITKQEEKRTQCKKNEHNQDTKKGIRIKIERKESYWLTQNKMVQPDNRRQLEEWRRQARN
jgi:hypothetical protein